MLLLALFLFHGSNASLAAAPVYPGADWETVEPAKVGWNAEALKKWEDSVFTGPQVTDAVVVIHQGRIVSERYARGYSPTLRHVGWSVAKSVWTTLFGIAEGKGLVSRDDTVTKFFPEKKGTAWDEVKLSHLYSMSSGIDSDEGYQRSPFRSDIVAALYRTKHLGEKGMYRLRQTSRVAPPGERFAYASGETNLLSAAMKKVMPEEVYASLPDRELFEPIGAKSQQFERDHSGVYVGSSYVYATPRDFARFGYLHLRNGRWNGKQVVPEKWIEESRVPGTPFSTLRLEHRPMEAYSNGWWLNRPVPTAQIGKAIAAAPADMYWAEGHEGQYIFVIPSLDLVIVRMALDRGGKALNRESFFRGLIAAMPPAAASAAKTAVPQEGAKK